MTLRRRAGALAALLAHRKLASEDFQCLSCDKNSPNYLSTPRQHAASDPGLRAPPYVATHTFDPYGLGASMAPLTTLQRLVGLGCATSAATATRPATTRRGSVEELLNEPGDYESWTLKGFLEDRGGNA